MSLGTTSANTNYYFAEGYTGSSFQEYLFLLNPSPTVTATVTVVPVPEGLRHRRCTRWARSFWRRISASR